MDDEYFRLVVAFREDVGDHPDVRAILPVIYRSLKKPRKVGLKNAVLNNIHYRNLRTPGGIFLGPRATYDVELDRLDRVVARIIRGLYHHHTATRIPNDYNVAVFSEDGLRVSPSNLLQLQTEVLDPLSRTAIHSVGGTVFRYRYAAVATDPLSSAWLLTFYERVSFLGLVAPCGA